MLNLRGGEKCPFLELRHHRFCWAGSAGSAFDTIIITLIPLRAPFLEFTSLRLLDIPPLLFS